MRYRFGDFVLSPASRVLAVRGRHLPLIPRYFDLLVLLVGERDRAVGKQEIFDRVWADVVVSDSALTQAIRTIRRTLGDDPREPRFVRTVSRRGYQFVFTPVEMEEDTGPLHVAGAVDAGGAAVLAAHSAGDPSAGEPDVADPFEPLLGVLLREGPHAAASDAERYDAAVALHELGTAEALRRLDARAGHEAARAILRDARWDAQGAGAVPLAGAPGPGRTVWALMRLRCRHALAVASIRWAAASAGAATAGAVAGCAGGLALHLVSGGDAGLQVAVTLALVGAGAGALGGAGVGTGLAIAEAVARSARAVALAVGGAVMGLVTGWAAHHAARAMLAALFGRDMPALGGPLEGLVIGAATGIGYAVATRRLSQGGMAAPRGRARARVAVVTGCAAAAGAVLLALAGRHLVGASLDAMAGLFAGSQVGLDPLARLLGEDGLRPVTRTIVSAIEGLMFGAGTAFGLTTRPRHR